MADTLKIERFKKLLYNLLPKGKAWNRDPDSNLYALVESISQEFCRDDDRLEDLLREIDPFQTVELLEDWEAMLGLPEECLIDLELTIPERRAQVIQALNALGGANADYFERLLVNSGFTATVRPYFAPFVAGSLAGDKLTNGQRYFVAGSLAGERLYNTGWTFWWEVNTDYFEIDRFVAGDRAGERLAEYVISLLTLFRAGQNVAGDRLAEFATERIECIIKKLKPAHTNVIFTYGPSNL